MTFQMFMAEKQKLALNNNLEDSAVVILLEHVTGYETNELYMNIHSEISQEIIDKFDNLFFKYLYDNKPIQYIIGSSCFYGYDFIVNENVLIPRPETEELVENILYLYDEYFLGQKVDVCDIATGSGCIAISLALEEKNMNVLATDISGKALTVARKNNKKFHAGVHFLQGDMLDPLENQKFDIVVSNPPYIPNNEDVMSLVKDNEPSIALFGGDDGLKFYRIILSGIAPYLKDKAIIAFEHGYDKKDQIRDIAKTYFPKSKVKCLKDLEGKDRMTFIFVGDFNE